MFTLPALPFSPTAFGAWTTEETFSFHHGKHHAGYVQKLNTALEGSPLAALALEALIAKAREEKNAAVFNLSAQHFNHSFFWDGLHPDGGAPSTAMKGHIEKSFGSMSEFEKQFSQKALTLFGSGWTWLVRRPDGTLSIVQTKDAETPVGTSDIALLTLDVWEHAYYIDHRNDRQKFIDGFWKYINWERVEQRRT